MVRVHEMSSTDTLCGKLVLRIVIFVCRQIPVGVVDLLGDSAPAADHAQVPPPPHRVCRHQTHHLQTQACMYTCAVEDYSIDRQI